MSRIPWLLAIAPLLLCLVGELSGATAGSEVVELPTVLVNEQASSKFSGVTVIETGTRPGSDSAFSDLARQAAGFSLNDAGARSFGSTTTLRGLGNTPYFSDASAPVYFDDIPLASGFTFPTELYDFSRVAIFRGPQSASLFGRAGDAGVIQLISAEPGTQNAARSGLTVGSYGQFSFSVAAQPARNESCDASVNFGTSQRNGYVENTQLGRPVDDRAAIFGGVRLHYRPTSDLEFSLHLLGQRSRDGAQALVPLGGPYYQVSRGQEGEADTDFAAVAASITKRLDRATVTSTTSFTDWDLSPYANRLVVFGGLNLDSALTQAQRTFNEEIRCASDGLTGGLFYSHATTTGAALRSISGYPIEDSSFDLHSETFALLGQASLKPTPAWLITPGLRFESTTKDFTRSAVVPALSRFRENDYWSALLPSLAITRHLDGTTDLVMTVARGFKPGGYSAYTGFESLAGYQPQSTWGVEVALSTSSADSRWSLSSRGYAYRTQGYQIERSFAVPGSLADEYLVVNAERAQILGLEGELSWRPTGDLTIGVMAALTQAILKDFTDPFTKVNYSGNRAPYAPSGNAALRIDYRPAHGFVGGASLTWTDRTFYDEQETAQLSQPAYMLANAYAGYAFAQGSVRLFGRNLGDKAYYSSITPGLSHGSPGAPFTWGGEFNFRW